MLTQNDKKIAAMLAEEMQEAKREYEEDGTPTDDWQFCVRRVAVFLIDQRCQALWYRREFLTLCGVEPEYWKEPITYDS